MRAELHRELKQGLRFLVLGATNSVLSIGLYWVLQHALSLALAYSTAYVAGLVFSASMSGRFVFRVPAAGQQVATVFLAYLGVFGVGLGLVALLQEGLGLSPLLAGIGSLCVSAPLNYLAGRWVLVRGSRPPVSSVNRNEPGNVTIP